MTVGVVCLRSNVTDGMPIASNAKPVSDSHYASPGIKIKERHGIYLPECDLYLDPKISVDRAFVSHAHADHIGTHQWTLCTPATAKLMAARGKVAATTLEAAYREEVDLGSGWRAVLLPAGHVLGAAMLHVTAPDGATLLYTGDFKLREPLASEPCELRPAQTLVIETTYGLPRFVFPEAKIVAADMVEFCKAALEEGDTPVVCAYSLGKAQEVAEALAGERLPMMAHGAVVKMAKLCRELRGGVGQVPPNYSPSALADHVLIIPPSAINSPMLRKIRRPRIAAVTGWALQPGAEFRYGAEILFPLSDHADYKDLLATVEAVSPEIIYTVHGYTREFAADLRRRGFDARTLGVHEQLDLALSACDTSHDNTVTLPLQPDSETVSDRFLESQAGFDTLLHLSSLCRSIAAKPSRLEKKSLLANYLRLLPQDALPVAVTFVSGLTGSVPLQIGWALIRKALIAASRLTEADINAVSARQCDSGATVRDIMQMAHSKQIPAGSEPLTLAATAQWFNRLAAERSPTTKISLLAEWLRHQTPAEAELTTRIITGSMRLGLKDGLLEEAIAEALHQPVSLVRRAHMLTGDLAATSSLAAAGRLESATMVAGHPVRVMLANSLPTPEAIWHRLMESSPLPLPILLEDKYDGIRCQAHVTKGHCRLFSRDLNDISGTFPELCQAMAKQGLEAVLDGEIVTGAAQGRSGFQVLQRRLSRQGDDFFLGEEVPVEFVVFDILWHDGVQVLDWPLYERRKRLDSLPLALPVRRVHTSVATSARDIACAFEEARARGSEGLLIKNPASTYAPGARGYDWIKLKRAGASLDVVVVRAEWGHGKRRGVLSDYTFAVRDTANSGLLTIGKAYTGLTNEEIADLTQRFLESAFATDHHGVDVSPTVVLEVAFDALQPSNRYPSGLAMRFPRIIAIRHDKSPDQIDTLATAQSIATQLAPPTDAI